MAKQSRSYRKRRSRSLTLISYLVSKAKFRNERFHAAAKESTHLLSSTLAASGLNLGIIPSTDHLGLSGDKRNERTDSEVSTRKDKRKNARETGGDLRWSGNVSKHQQRASRILFPFGMWKECSIEPGAPRVGSFSKDQNENQNSSRRRRSRKSRNAASHRSSDRTFGTVRDAHSDYPRDKVTLNYTTDFSLKLRMPQPADDDTISRALRNLFHFVAQHVSTFYMNDFDDVIPEHALIPLRYLHSPSPSLTVDEALEDMRCKQAMIEHCLNHLLLSSISINFGSQQANTSNGYEPPKYPLLPAAFTAIPQASARSSTALCDEKYYLQALSRLRVLSSFLVPDIASSEEYQKQKGEMIGAAITDFSQAFSPWEKRQHSSGARLNNLKVIFEKAAKIGILLFSQPSVFEFDWTSDGVAERPAEVTLSPSLFKVADENGTTLSLPQKMIDIRLSALQPRLEIEMNLSDLTLSEIPAIEEVDDRAESPNPGKEEGHIP